MNLGELLSFSVVAFTAIFFVVDPPGVVPIFVAMTANDSVEKRNSMAARASLVAGALMTLFALFGGVIFQVFGITLGAFKVAGGILLILTALDMLRAQTSRTRSSPDEQLEGIEKEDVAIVPLAVPLLAGPGALATVMVVMARGHGLVAAIPVVGAIVVTCLVAYAILRAAHHVDRVLGKSGLAILHRVMGLLLAAIAVQFMSDGLHDLFPNLDRAVGASPLLTMPGRGA